MSIVKITLNIGGKEVELSLQEAKQLQRDLNQMFGEAHTPSPLGRYFERWQEVESKRPPRFGEWPPQYAPLITCATGASAVKTRASQEAGG